MIIPFKFRYYDDVLNIFFYLDDFEFENDYEKIVAFFNKAKNFATTVDVGFNHNGNIIYTNDIILRPHGRKGVVKFTKGVFGVIWEEDYVISDDPDYKEGMLYGSWGQNHNLRSLDDDMEFIVIGNTYQNINLVMKKE